MVHLKELPEYAKFVSCVEDHRLLPEESNVIVAVSGGADSVALLCLFLAYLPSSRIVVAHVNHGIRGGEAVRDALFVQKLCARFQLDFQLKELDIPSISKRTGKGMEESARIERYHYLQTLAHERNGVIAVAHHREDRAETILMNLARGTGIDGLKGISHRHGNIIRPLLDFSKEEILRICTLANVVPVMDSTNLEDCTLRNRVRHHVIPYLSEIFERDIVDKLLDLSEFARIDSEFLDSYTQEALARMARQEGQLWVVDRTAFAKEAESIQNRILRKLIPEIRNQQDIALYPHGKDLTSDMIARVRSHLLAGKSGKMVEIGRQIQCRIEGERCVLYLCTDFEPSEAVKYPEIEIYSFSGYETKMLLKNKPINYEYFDYSKLEVRTGGDFTKIEMRHIRTGDIFSPFGLQGSMRLQKFLIDKKIPISHRKKIWVVAIENQILWIPGIRRSNVGCITSSTNKIIQIKVELEDAYDA